MMFLIGCATNRTITKEFIRHKGVDYVVYESSRKENFDGFVCIEYFNVQDKYYCIEAFQPMCELVERKEMGPMLKLTYKCGPNQDVIYRYVGDKK